MSIKLYRNIALSLIVAGSIISCGGGGSSSSDDDKASGGDISLTKGYLLDSAIEGVNYSCGAITGVTDASGEFSCEVAPVTFSVGGLTLGSIDAFTSDGKVYPQDLLGLSRDDLTNPKLIKLIRLLQSLDDDGEIDKKISIETGVASKFDKDSGDLELEVLVTMGGGTLVSEEDAIAHLKATLIKEGVIEAPSIDPVVQDINSSLSENDEATIILGEKDDLLYNKVTDPAHGEVTIVDNSAIYTPEKDFHGVDSFTYQSTIGESNSNIATVNITVNDFVVTSTAYDDGARIPKDHVCSDHSGSNQSPPFSWENSPQSTVSYALIMDDEVSPCGQGDSACKHWGLFNIPSVTNELSTNLDISTIDGAIEGLTYAGTNNYAGPCPPSKHTYKTTIFALKEGMPTLKSVSMTRSKFKSKYSEYILNSATIAGTYP